MEQPTGTPTTPAGVVAAANALVGLLDEDALGGEDVGGTGRDGRADRDACGPSWPALEASVLAEIDARQIPKKELAWGSTADWFTHLAGTTRGKGHRTVQQAPILVGERTATHAAMLAGRVSPEQAAVIVAAVEKLPLDAAVRDHAEAVLLEEAARLNATDLGRPPSAWSSWPTPTRRSGTPRRRWTGRTGPPTTAGTCPSARTVPAASGSGAAAPSRTPPCSRPPSCR